MTALIDTDVLIDHLRGLVLARDFLLKLVSDEIALSVSAITVAEIEAGLRSGEQAMVDALFASMKVFPVTTEIARTAGRYKAKFARSDGVLLPDALIAATALHHDCELCTLNRKHYPMPDIQINVPYRKN